MIRHLTPRQQQVIELASQGLSARQIANEVGISSRTVEIHRGAAIKALGAVNIVHAAVIYERQVAQGGVA